MSRNLTSNMAAEVIKPVIAPVLFCDMDFDSGAIFMWSGVGDLTWNGHVYSGGGNLVSISPYQETEDVQSQGLTFVLTGVPSDLIAITLEEQYQGRPIKLYLGLFDRTAGTVINDPYLLFAGIMDTMEINDDGSQAAIKLNAENVIYRLTQNKLRNYTGEDQKARFPTDLGLDFIPALQDENVVWQAL